MKGWAKQVFTEKDLLAAIQSKEKLAPTDFFKEAGIPRDAAKNIAKIIAVQISKE